MRQKRIEYIDLSKGFCIVLVVLFHVYASYGQPMPAGKYLMLFRLPLYYFLSGCFFKPYNSFSDFLRRKTNKLLVPFIFFYVTLSCIVPFLINKLVYSKFPCLEFNSFLTGFTRAVFPNLAIWFLLCLFLMNIVYYIIWQLAHKITCGRWISCAIIIALAALSYSSWTCVRDYYIRDTLRFLPFLALGTYVFHHTNVLQPNRFDRYLWVQVLLAFFVVWLSRNTGMPMWLMRYIGGVSGVYGIMALAKWLGHLPILSYIGRYSIMTLVTHCFYMLIVLIVVEHFPLNSDYKIITAFIFTMILCFYSIPLLRKYLPHVTAQEELISKDWKIIIKKKLVE